MLITGAGSGLGKQLAHDLAAKGANLVLWDIRKKLLINTGVCACGRVACVRAGDNVNVCVCVCLSPGTLHSL